jgi:hypothetical protein
MGDVKEKMGDFEEAKEWWRKSLEKDGTRDHLMEKLNTN